MSESLKRYLFVDRSFTHYWKEDAKGMVLSQAGEVSLLSDQIPVDARAIAISWEAEMESAPAFTWEAVFAHPGGGDLVQPGLVHADETLGEFGVTADTPLVAYSYELFDSRGELGVWITDLAWSFNMGEKERIQELLVELDRAISGSKAAFSSLATDFKENQKKRATILASFLRYRTIAYVRERLSEELLAGVLEAELGGARDDSRIPETVRQLLAGDEQSIFTLAETWRKTHEDRLGELEKTKKNLEQRLEKVGDPKDWSREVLRDVDTLVRIMLGKS